MKEREGRERRRGRERKRKREKVCTQTVRGMSHRIVWKDHPRYTASWPLYDEKKGKMETMVTIDESEVCESKLRKNLSTT